MHRFKLALLFSLGMGLSTITGSAVSSDHGQLPDRAAFEAALEACANSVDKDERGGPNHEAMDACMQAKGFTKPAGGHGKDGKGGHRPPSPPR